MIKIRAPRLQFSNTSFPKTTCQREHISKFQTLPGFRGFSLMAFNMSLGTLPVPACCLWYAWRIWYFLFQNGLLVPADPTVFLTPASLSFQGWLISRVSPCQPEVWPDTARNPKTTVITALGIQDRLQPSVPLGITLGLNHWLSETLSQFEFSQKQTLRLTPLQPTYG